MYLFICFVCVLGGEGVVGDLKDYKRKVNITAQKIKKHCIKGKYKAIMNIKNNHIMYTSQDHIMKSTPLTSLQ